MKRPTLYAVLLGAGYAVFGLSYIVLSTHLAASSSRSVEELRTVEMLKGAGYIAVTAALIVLAARALLARIQRDGEELLKQQRALLTNERRAYAGLIASTIAHDANNVLTVVAAELQMLMRVVDPAERKKTLEQLDASLERLVSLNRRLHNAGQQAAKSTRTRFELGQMVAASIDRLRAHPKLSGRKITLERAAPVYVQMEPVVIEMIVTNLVLNAGEATQRGGRVQLTVGSGERAFIEVDDDGPGVPVERRPGLFTALETTKPDGNGLGLFSVQASAKSVGGAVTVGDSSLGGARFRVELPPAAQLATP